MDQPSSCCNQVSEGIGFSQKCPKTTSLHVKLVLALPEQCVACWEIVKAKERESVNNAHLISFHFMCQKYLVGSCFGNTSFIFVVKKKFQFGP